MNISASFLYRSPSVDDPSCPAVTRAALFEVFEQGNAQPVFSRSCDLGLRFKQTATTETVGFGGCSVTWTAPSVIADGYTARVSILDGTTVKDTDEVTLVRRKPQTITFAPPESATVGDVLTLTASSSSASGMPIIFAAQTPGTCATGGANGAALTLKAKGACEVWADQALNDQFERAPTVKRTIVVLGKQQTPLQLATASFAYGTSLTLAATGGSGTGALGYKVVSGATSCEIADGDKLRGIGLGDCVVEARKEADSEYDLTTSQTLFTVEQGPQDAFAIDAPASLSYYETAQLGATGGSGNGAVIFALIAGQANCSLTGANLKALVAGASCTVRATKAADGPYLAATADAVVRIAEKSPQAELRVIAGPLTFPGSITLSAKGGTTGGTVTFALLSGPCTLSGATLASTATGTCRVAATMAGDGGYRDVTSPPLDISVTPNLAPGKAALMLRGILLDTGRAVLDDDTTQGRFSQRETGGPAVALLPEGSSGKGSLAFKASLGQHVARDGKGNPMGIVPASAPPPPPSGSVADGLEAWVDGRLVWSGGEDGALDSRIFLGSAGVDYLVTPKLLLGLTARMDSTRASGGGDDGDIDALGWMAGPYAILRLEPGLQLDGKLLWGRSEQDISLVSGGVPYDGSYATTRWQAEAGLRGTVHMPDLLLEPGARLQVYNERAEAFTLDGAGEVAAQELTLVRLVLDPRISAAFTLDDGVMVSPYLTPKLIAEWQSLTGEGEGWDVYAGVDAGLTLKGPGYTAWLTGSVSGIGSEEGPSYGARAGLALPLP